MPNSRTVSRSTGRTPEYRRIAGTLRDEIASQYQPGDALPSEHALAARFGVNRHTVRRGVDELVEDGLLVRHRGRGTIVLSTPIDFPITLDRRFSELVRQSGHETSNRILTRKVAPAPLDAARALELPEAAEVVFLEQVRLMDAMPLAISRHWLPMPRFAFLLERFHRGSLHQMIGSQLGVSIQLKHAIVRAHLPAADDALNLRISPKTPVMTARMTDADAETGQTVEYVEQVFRADATQLCLVPGPEPALTPMHGA